MLFQAEKEMNVPKRRRKRNVHDKKVHQPMDISTKRRGAEREDTVHVQSSREAVFCSEGSIGAETSVFNRS
jgi:hypothetical protein